MIQGKDKVLVEQEIKTDIPTFNREKLREYTKNAISNIYNAFKDNNPNNIKIRISKELINKISNNLELYRISSNFDKITIQYVDICDYEKRLDGNYVKVYAIIAFYDNYENNTKITYYSDKFWNDVWIITYKALSNIDNNCKNCGSEMEYNKEKDAYECKFCRSSFPRDAKDWKIVDIEVEK